MAFRKKKTRNDNSSKNKNKFIDICKYSPTDVTYFIHVLAQWGKCSKYCKDLLIHHTSSEKKCLRINHIMVFKLRVPIYVLLKIFKIKIPIYDYC